MQWQQSSGITTDLLHQLEQFVSGLGLPYANDFILFPARELIKNNWLWFVRSDGELQACFWLLDAFNNAADAAEIAFFAASHLPHKQLVQQATEIARPLVRRTCLEAPAWQQASGKALAANGYKIAYKMYRMARTVSPAERFSPANWPQGYTVKELSPAYLTKYHAVLRRAFAGIPSVMIPDHDEFANLQMSLPLRAQLLVDANDQIIAFYRVRLFSDQPEEGEIAIIGRDPNHRGHGLGDLLMQQASWALHLANPLLQRIQLEVAAVNDQAIALYQRHGLQVESETPVYRL